MKKIALAIAVFAFTPFVACKKDYTCVCSTASPVPGFTIPDQETALGKQKKKQAESLCAAKNNNITFSGFTISTTCKLK